MGRNAIIEHSENIIIIIIIIITIIIIIRTHLI